MKGLQQVVGGEDVALEGLARVLPRVGDVRGAGEVIDGRRLKLGDGRDDRGAVQQLDGLPAQRRGGERPGAGPLPSHDIDALVEQQLNEMGADEAGGSCHRSGAGSRTRGHAIAPVRSAPMASALMTSAPKAKAVVPDTGGSGQCDLRLPYCCSM